MKMEDPNLSFKITNDEGVQKFMNSQAYQDIVNFISDLNKSVIGVEMKPLDKFILKTENNSNNTNTDNILFLSKNVYNILQLIKSMNGCIDKCPPIKHPTRFGNKAFPIFCDEYYKEVDHQLPNILNESGISNISEHTYQLSFYLKNSIGNKKRIDYGTGHELNFLLFLFCLNKLTFFSTPDHKHLVLVLYRQYLECVRRIQVIYTVEPAGSRGAWGLDDFQFLVFLFGAAQLSYNKEIQTNDVEKKELVELWAPKYLYFDALKYILMLKHAPFHESSQMLYDISGVKTWEKICSGLLKMYQAEIIQKRQILQHILFGKLIDF